MSIIGVFEPRRFVRLTVADAMNVSRDPMLIFAAAMSIIPILAYWLGAGALDTAALSAFSVPHFSRYVAPLVVLLPAVMVGWVTGFLLLEDRDEGLLPALDVTPVGKVGFLAYRTFVTAALTAVIVAVAMLVVAPTAGFWIGLLVAALTAAYAVLAAVILPAFARNKVEGLALVKLTNIAVVVPLLAAVPSPWRYLAGIVPTYWIGELLALSDSPLSASIVAPIAILVELGWGIALFKAFASRFE